MTNSVQNNQGNSLSLVKLESRLSLTLHHLNVVHAALIEARNKNNVAIINHAITPHCEAILRNLYAHLNEYLKSILSEMFYKRPLQIIYNTQENVKFTEIVKFGNYESICDHMINRVFRKLENSSNRSTARLIESILDTTSIKLDENVRDDALWYIELRHLFVHNSSRMDKKFADQNSKKILYNKEGNKIPMSLGTARSGIKAVQKLSRIIDNDLCRGGYVESHVKKS